VRIVAATNRDPKQAVAEGKLREDLLYRLLVFPIDLPPLRERKGDLELLTQHFLDALNARANTTKTISEAAIARLRRHTWPGNVRELKHVIERAFILAPTEVDEDAIPLARETIAETAAPNESGVAVEVGVSIAELERRLILATLRHCEGNKNKAAEILGISLKTLYNRLNAYKGFPPQPQAPLV
jgi:DNA-binding NtrC family response regulator